MTRVSTKAFEGTPQAPAAARRFVRETLAEWHLSHVAEDAVLLTSELVTNAVVHAGTDIELTCRLDAVRTPAALEIEVDDRHPTRTIASHETPPPDSLQTSGRGLALTSMLADAWGVTYTRRAKRVWLRIELTGGCEDRAAGAPASAPAAAAAPVESLRVAVIVSDADGLVVSWNSEAEALLGWPAKEVIGTPLSELVSWREHGSQAPALAGMLAMGRWRGETRMRHRDGRLAPVYLAHLRTQGRSADQRAIWLVVADDHRYVLAQPATPLRREADRRIRDLISSGRPVTERVEAVAQHIHAVGGHDAVYILLAGHEPGWFAVAAGAGDTTGLLRVAARGLFENRAPVIVDDLAVSDFELAQELRARSLACAPLIVAGEVTGYLVVTAAEQGRFDGELGVTLQHIAEQLAVAVERERLSELERAHRGRLAFLAEAGELLAGVHDEDLIAALTAQLVVPKIATWAAVYLTGLTGLSRLAHVWHTEERFNAELRRSLPAQLPQRAPEPLGRESVLSFPLLTGDRPLGTLVLGRSEPSFPRELAALVEDLCRRVALNLHTAMLYSRQATTSRVLQRSLLPVQVAAMPGIESAVVYEPAEEGAHVGGDFYDMFSVAGHWCFALGDVCGRGPEAAAVTGLARHAVRLLAKERYPVADILDRLNNTLLDEAEDSRFLSLLYGELTPLPMGGALCTIASAGHPPPLRLRAGGGVDVVATPQLLLGIRPEERFFDETFELQPDDVLLCVTDGVTERRNGNRLLDDGDGLSVLLAGCGGLSAHTVAERVRQAVDSFAADPSQDDVAVLVLKAKRAMSALRP